MTARGLSPSLTGVVRERDARAVRGYASRVESLGLSDGKTGTMINTARHVAVWLATSGLSLETFDIRLVDRFMRHVCHCPGRHGIGKRPGHDQRYFAIRFLRHLLETGHVKTPPEIEAGGHLALQFRKSLEMQGYARSGLIESGSLCRHFFVWLHLSGIPLAAADEHVRRRFLAHDCACVYPGFLHRPPGFAGSDSSGSRLRLLAAFLADRNVIPAPKVPERQAERWEHLDAFLHWLRQHRGLRDSSIEQYERRLRALLPDLGDDPETYDAARVRNTVLGRLETASREQVGREAIALRTGEDIDALFGPVQTGSPTGP